MTQVGGSRVATATRDRLRAGYLFVGVAGRSSPR
jgi:hypothetical protein